MRVRRFQPVNRRDVIDVGAECECHAPVRHGRCSVECRRARERTERLRVIEGVKQREAFVKESLRVGTLRRDVAMVRAQIPQQHRARGQSISALSRRRGDRCRGRAIGGWSACASQRTCDQQRRAEWHVPRGLHDVVTPDRVRARSLAGAHQDAFGRDGVGVQALCGNGGNEQTLVSPARFTSTPFKGTEPLIHVEGPFQGLRPLETSP